MATSSEKQALAKHVNQMLADNLELWLDRGYVPGNIASLLLDALEAAGYAVVPVEPTPEMLDAGGHARPPDGPYVTGSAWIRNRYLAMVGARPR